MIFSERDAGLSPGAVAVWFFRLYRDVGMIGAHLTLGAELS